MDELNERSGFPGSDRIRFLIRLVVIIGVAIPVIFSLYIGSSSVMKIFTLHLSPDIIVVPFISTLGIYLVDTWRLQIVLSQYGIRFEFLPGFYNSSLFLLFSNLTPLGSGGFPAQVAHLVTNGVNSKIAANICLSRVVVYMLAGFMVVVVFFKTVVEVSLHSGASIKLIYLGVLFPTIMIFSYIILLLQPSLIYFTLSQFRNIACRITPDRSEKILCSFDRISDWSREMTEIVQFLWSEKFYIIVLDLLLTLVILCLQAYSIYYVLICFTGSGLAFMDLFVVVAALNVLAGIIPTPGGSGGIEGLYCLVFSALTGLTEETMMAVIVWRFATYYLHIGFETMVFYYLPFRHRVIPESG